MRQVNAAPSVKTRAASNSSCGLAKGAFRTEKVFWFHFLKWIGTANAIGWPVRSFGDADGIHGADQAAMRVVGVGKNEPACRGG